MSSIERGEGRRSPASDAPIRPEEGKSAVEPSLLVDLAKGNLTPEESLRVIREIEHDPEASREFERIVRLVRYMERHVDEVVRKSEPEGASVGLWILHLRSMVPRHVPAPARVIGFAVLLVVGFIIAGRLSSSRYFELTVVGSPALESNVRGPGIEDFVLARRWYTSGNFDEAIRVLERYIRAFPEAGTCDYAHFLAGMSYLASSRQTTLGLFRRFDRERAVKGIEHLSAAIALSSNERIIEESRLLRAKGYLMVEDPDAAIGELLALTPGHSVPSEEARMLLIQISTLEHSSGRP